jgi:predicted urease superfamily metal-dependent hydrolase
VASAGFDRSGGSELAEIMTKTVAELRGQRPEQRAQYQHEQRARLGDKADGLVADAAKALQGVHPDVLNLLNKSGALDNADVIAQLAHMAQARATHG